MDEAELQRMRDACEDDGRCEWRIGPDGWCDSCVAAHLHLAQQEAQQEAQQAINRDVFRPKP
jgi:hypothetical protein